MNNDREYVEGTISVGLVQERHRNHSISTSHQIFLSPTTWSENTETV